MCLLWSWRARFCTSPLFRLVDFVYIHNMANKDNFSVSVLILLLKIFISIYKINDYDRNHKLKHGWFQASQMWSAYSLLPTPDLVVGSPYDGRDGRGAVYIFHGSKEGIIRETSQVVYAHNLDNRLRAFGFSLSAGMDLDENGYPGRFESWKKGYISSSSIAVLKSEAM